MNEEIFYRISGSSLFVILFFLLIAASISGYLAGKRNRELVSETVKSHISTLQSSLLGLLALMLGFTFAMTESRYDLRKQLVLEEANALGTTYLRARLLPEPYASEAASLLREYVNLRAELFKSGSNETDEVKLNEVNEKSGQFHDQLWSVARNAASGDPRAVTTGLFIQSLNDVIDLHTKRLIALDNHIPEPIIMLLWATALLSMALTSYNYTLAEWRHFVVTTIMALLITSIIYLIMDLDRPRRGLIQVSQKSMLMLHENMLKNKP